MEVGVLPWHAIRSSTGHSAGPLLALRLPPPAHPPHRHLPCMATASITIAPASTHTHPEPPRLSPPPAPPPCLAHPLNGRQPVFAARQLLAAERQDGGKDGQQGLRLARGEELHVAWRARERGGG